MLFSPPLDPLLAYWLLTHYAGPFVFFRADGVRVIVS